MPQCRNAPKAYYKGTEPSPKGKGYCARAEPVGKRRKGGDGKMWTVKTHKVKGKTVKAWRRSTTTTTATTKKTTKPVTKKKPVKTKSKATTKKKPVKTKSKATTKKTTKPVTKKKPVKTKSKVTTKTKTKRTKVSSLKGGLASIPVLKDMLAELKNVHNDTNMSYEEKFKKLVIFIEAMTGFEAVREVDPVTSRWWTDNKDDIYKAFAKWFDDIDGMRFYSKLSNIDLYSQYELETISEQKSHRHNLDKYTKKVHQWILWANKNMVKQNRDRADGESDGGGGGGGGGGGAGRQLSNEELYDSEEENMSNEERYEREKRYRKYYEKEFPKWYNKAGW
jgi:hypothetical protein